MNIPWLKEGEEKEGLREKALEVACAIASPFGSADGRTFPRVEPTDGRGVDVQAKIRELKQRLGLNA